MQTAEPVSTMRSNERLVKILYISYSKAYLEQVATNTNQLNSKYRTELLRLLDYSEELFCVTLGDCHTYPVNLELKPDYKPFNCKSYPFPVNNKQTFCKNIE